MHQPNNKLEATIKANPKLNAEYSKITDPKAKLAFISEAYKRGDVSQNEILSSHDDSKWWYRAVDNETKYLPQKEYDKLNLDDKEDYIKQGDKYYARDYDNPGHYINYQPTPDPKQKLPKDPPVEEKETPLGELPKFNYQGEPQPNNYNISLGNFNIPSNLAKDPVALGLTDPSYIDPRYLDIQPQLNDVQRGKSMFQRNLGSRTSTDIGNLLQSQALGYDQAQQAYGQKYNYDQQQDNNAQQFNAQARMNTAERNMNRVDAFNDLRYRRDAAYTLQQQNKEQQEIQNSMLQNNYDTRNNFIGEHFSYPGGNTPYSLGQGYASGVQGNDGDYTSMKKNKDGTRTYTYEKTVSANGGLVIKPKKKMKKLK
jgi:hypothetical protein